MPSAKTFQDALTRYGGMYASAWSGGRCLYEAVEVSGVIEIGRTDIPIVGKTRVGHKPSRESADGTLRVQKIDARWEHFVHQFLSQNLDQRRAARGTPDATLRQFSLKVVYDDPEAGGREVWQLEGCQIWRLTLGFSITDDYVEREYPLTWEEEFPVETFEYDADGNVVQVNSIHP